MREKGTLENWASVALGVICVALLINLVFHNRVRAGAAPPRPNADSRKGAHIPLPPLGQKDDLARYNPEIKLDVLADLQARPTPEIARNPFDYPPVKVVPTAAQHALLPSAPAGPPPPPPLPFKLIGYSEKAGGLREGIIADEEDIYVVHIGDIFAKHYRVTKISPTSAEIVDETTRQTAQLPITP